jgi:Uri superfamily endonuclease
MIMVKGVYVLVISVGKDVEVNVGALGSVFFEKGVYAYVGSAQTNLEKRVRRHLRKVKAKFWHIDYLLGNRFVKVMKVFYKEAEKSEECRIARKLYKMCDPVLNFGCSDCGCVSHLFMLNDSDYSKNSTAFLTANFSRSVQANRERFCSIL